MDLLSSVILAICSDRLTSSSDLVSKEMISGLRACGSWEEKVVLFWYVSCCSPGIGPCQDFQIPRGCFL